MNIADDLVKAFNDGYVQGKADAVVHGHWIDDEVLCESKCFKCGKTWNWFDNCMEDWNFCPNCGADLRGESDG